MARRTCGPSRCSASPRRPAGHCRRAAAPPVPRVVPRTAPPAGRARSAAPGRARCRGGPAYGYRSPVVQRASATGTDRYPRQRRDERDPPASASFRRTAPLIGRAASRGCQSRIEGRYRHGRSRASLRPATTPPPTIPSISAARLQRQSRTDRPPVSEPPHRSRWPRATPAGPGSRAGCCAPVGRDRGRTDRS